MEWLIYIAAGLGIALFAGTRIAWRRRTYSEILIPYLAQHGCELVRIDIPRFYKTGSFPKIAVRAGALQTTVAGIDTPRFEHRIVTSRDTGKRLP